jgi:hypothetical protein
MQIGEKEICLECLDVLEEREMEMEVWMEEEQGGNGKWEIEMPRLCYVDSGLIGIRRVCVFVVTEISERAD